MPPKDDKEHRVPGPNRPPLPGYPALRDEIDASPFTRVEVGAEAGYTESAVSRYLSGERAAPDGFEIRMRAGLARLKRDHDVAMSAIRAAREAGVDPDGDAA